ncbi:MAG: chromosome segregation protein SMC, partial [Roseovarius sp.]|nr:chromosome segregation protein SMC [Roseovarius sp.]
KAARKVEMAQLSVTNAKARLDALHKATAEKSEATAQASGAAKDAQAAKARLETRHAEKNEAEQVLDAAQAALKQAEDAKRRADRAQAARDGADRREDLAKRIADAEKARNEMELAAAAARTGPDASALRALDKLDSRHAAAIAARDATATRVIARYAGDQHGIHAEGHKLPEGESVPLPRTTRLLIDGVGELEVRPGGTGHDERSIEAAETELREALAAIGADSVEQARKAADRRQAAERRHGAAQAVLENLAPDGIERLREALARIPEPAEDADAPAPEAAQTALARARSDHDTARAARDRAVDRLSDARAEATRADTSLASLQERMKRAEDAVAALGDITEDAIATEVAEATATLDKAKADHAEKERAAPDLESAAAALKRAESVERKARDEIARLTPLLATLEERIARSSGDAVEERLAETEQELDAARKDLARVEREVAVLIRLEEALEAARTEARERYFEPVARELRPLLGLLWPDAELTWGQDTLLPDALIRNGQEERIDILSGGTQEQVALLVRLAFARMLAAAGRVAPVILDDALVFTDDDRIERMFDALHRQAGDLQIIVLTCRQRVFRELGGNTLRLGTPPGEEGAA